MTKFTPLGSTACVIALLSAGAAHADVTAEDVWANWQENFAMYGDDGVTIGDVSKDRRYAHGFRCFVSCGRQPNRL